MLFGHLGKKIANPGLPQFANLLATEMYGASFELGRQLHARARRCSHSSAAGGVWV
jgi:hypothetical protein